MRPQQVRPELHPLQLHIPSEPVGWRGSPFPGVFVGREPSLKPADPPWGMSSLGCTAQPGTNSSMFSFLSGADLCREKQILEERLELPSQACLGLLENVPQGKDG